MFWMGNARNGIAVTVAAIFSLVLLASTTLPSLVSAQAGDDASTKMALHNKYLSEAQTAFSEMQKLDANIAEDKVKIVNTTDEQERQNLQNQINLKSAQMSTLDNHIRQLEKLNMALYEIDSASKEKLYSSEKQLLDKYVNSQSSTYVSGNAVEMVIADQMTRNITIIVNPDKVAAGNKMPMEKEINGIPIQITYGKLEEISCTNNSRTGVCRPLIGGVSVSEINTLSLNTLGYKAILNGVEGFVIAAHTAVQPLSTIIQPHNDATKVVGQTQAFCRTTNICDFAWVRPSTGITVDNQIFKSTDGQVYYITGKTPDSSQTIGSFVIKSGAASGLTLGSVTQNSPNVPNNIADASSSGGDSGSPIFYESGGNASLYGMVYATINYQGKIQLLYYPWDYISSQIGATPHKFLYFGIF